MVHDLIVCDPIGPLLMSQLHQEVEQVIATGVLRLIELPIARVMLVVLVILDVVIFGGPLIIVHEVASIPLVEPQRAQVEIVLLQIVRLSRVLDPLFGTHCHLEGVL